MILTIHSVTSDLKGIVFSLPDMTRPWTQICTGKSEAGRIPQQNRWGLTPRSERSAVPERLVSRNDDTFGPDGVNRAQCSHNGLERRTHKFSIERLQTAITSCAAQAAFQAWFQAWGVRKPKSIHKIPFLAKEDKK